MTTYNTPSDAANTAVRSFLTKLGESYLKHTYNTSSGKGKRIWLEIKTINFSGRCAYCDEECPKPTIEHIIMFNRTECGLHHPGNTIPCCSKCNKRKKINGQYEDWEAHLLQIILDEKGSAEIYKERKSKIRNHIQKYCYPDLTTDEVNTISAMAESLYQGIKMEIEKNSALFNEIDRTLMRGRPSRRPTD